MKKFKKVLGLIAIVGLCILGLASCKNGKVTVEVTTTASYEPLDEARTVTGDLYVNENGILVTLLIGDDGELYVGVFNATETELVFRFIETEKKSDHIFMQKTSEGYSNIYAQTDDYIVHYRTTFKRVNSLEEALNELKERRNNS